MTTTIAPAIITNQYGSSSRQGVNFFAIAQTANFVDLFDEKQESDKKQYNDPIYLIYDKIDNQTLGQTVAGFIKETSKSFKKILAA